jgi:hypothetical protein
MVISSFLIMCYTSYLTHKYVVGTIGATFFPNGFGHMVMSKFSSSKFQLIVGHNTINVEMMPIFSNIILNQVNIHHCGILNVLKEFLDTHYNTNGKYCVHRFGYTLNMGL